MAYTVIDLAWFVYTVLISLLAILGNGFICQAIYSDRQQTTVYRLIATQCLSDLLFGFFQLFRFVLCTTAFVSLGRLALFICELVGIIIIGSFYVSAVTITAIAIERYLKICSTKVKLYSWYGRHIVCIVWTISFFLTLGESVGVALPVFFSRTHFMRCFRAFSEVANHEVFIKRYFTRFNVSVAFVLPIFIISACYYVIIKKIKRVDRMHVVDLEHAEKCRQRRRTVNMLICIVIAYYAFQTPMLLVSSIVIIYKGEMIYCSDKNEYAPTENYNLMLLLFSIYMLTMVVNPFILCYFNEKLRLKLRSVANMFETSIMPISVNQS